MPDIHESEHHSIATSWLAMTAREVNVRRQHVGYPEVIRIPCACGGSMVVELIGDPVADEDRLIDAFTRSHDEGSHEAPVKAVPLRTRDRVIPLLRDRQARGITGG